MDHQILKIRKPDDWHVHLRDDNMLLTVLPYTSRYFARAIIMPNLTPPITTIAHAIAYRERILSMLPSDHHFTPLMTCYLTDIIDKKTLINGYRQKLFIAAKLYPAKSTTNSQYGVTNLTNIYPLLDIMSMIGMPLLVHGEVMSSEIDIFDREAFFIEQVMVPIRRHFPTLKIVFEHISTKEAVDYVLTGDNYLAATITPQHLMFNRNHMFINGICPHLYCMPILKRNIHQESLRKALASGCNRFFIGTDTAPHTRKDKETKYGCAGIFNALNALPAYATVFEEIGALKHFEAFCSINGPHFYGLSINNDFITLKRELNQQPASISLIDSNDETLIPFLAKSQLNWKVLD